MQYQVYQNILQPIFSASGSFQCPVASLFATSLIGAALGILHWLICKRDVASVFFNLHIVSKSPASAQFWNCALALICLFSKTGPKTATRACFSLTILPPVIQW